MVRSGILFSVPSLIKVAQGNLEIKNPTLHECFESSTFDTTFKSHRLIDSRDWRDDRSRPVTLADSKFRWMAAFRFEVRSPVGILSVCVVDHLPRL